MMENTSSTPFHRHFGTRHHVWLGKSGRRYVHAVYPADACPDLEDAVCIAVGRDAEGSRRPIAIEGRSGFAEAAFAHARRGSWPGGGRVGDLAVDEIHVHFVARAKEGLRSALEDLSAGYGLTDAQT